MLKHNDGSDRVTRVAAFLGAITAACTLVAVYVVSPLLNQHNEALTSGYRLIAQEKHSDKVDEQLDKMIKIQNTSLETQARELLLMEQVKQSIDRQNNLLTPIVQWINTAPGGTGKGN